MRTRAIIELTHLSDGELPLELLEAAYRASDSVSVVLVLPATMIRLVDRLLDPIVETVGPTSGGIRYVDSSEDATVRAVLSSAAFAVALTPAFRTRCLSMGIPVLGVEAAIARLRTGVGVRAVESAGTLASPPAQQVAAAG